MPLCVDCFGVTISNVAEDHIDSESIFVATCEMSKSLCRAEIAVGSLSKAIEENWVKEDIWLKEIPVGNLFTETSPEISKKKDTPKTGEDFW